MEFTKDDLLKFAELADNHSIVIIEGKNGLGQKFKTIGCFIPEQTALGEYFYIQKDRFALFQGEYNKGEKQYCAFFISPDTQYVDQNCLFVDTIKTNDGALVYKNPNFQKVQAFALYNKLKLPKGFDYTPSKIYDLLLMHIGKPMTYKNANATLMSLLTKNDVTFAVFSTGTSLIEGIVEPFEVHSSEKAKKNLMLYSNSIEHQQ